MKLYPSDKTYDDLMPLNASVLDINKKSAGEHISAYRSSVLSSLGERTETVISRQYNTISALEIENMHIRNLLSDSLTKTQRYEKKLKKNIRHKKRYKITAILLGMLLIATLACHFWMI